MKILSNCSISYNSWELANIVKSSCLIWNCDRNSGCRCLYNGCPKFWVDYHVLNLDPPFRSWWNQWVVIAAHHCYSWWRWWSDTLWVTLIGLQHTHCHVSFKVLWNLLHNLIDMLNYLMHNVCILNHYHIDWHFASLNTSWVKAKMMYLSSKNRFQRELDSSWAPSHGCLSGEYRCYQQPCLLSLWICSTCSCFQFKFA
jgi:hypothetical protein